MPPKGIQSKCTSLFCTFFFFFSGQGGVGQRGAGWLVGDFVCLFVVFQDLWFLDHHKLCHIEICVPGGWGGCSPCQGWAVKRVKKRKWWLEQYQNGEVYKLIRLFVIHRTDWCPAHQWSWNLKMECISCCLVWQEGLFDAVFHTFICGFRFVTYCCWLFNCFFSLCIVALLFCRVLSH